jgi:hypothetical protein
MDLGSDDSSDVGPGTSPTRLDLAKFRKHGIAKLREHFGAADFTNARIFFRDGAGAIDSPPAFDHARLLLVADVESLNPMPDVHVAYYAGLQGDEGFRYVSAGSLEYFDGAGIALIKADLLDDPGVAALIEQMSQLAPGATIEHLDQIGLITFSAPDGKGFLPLFALVSKSPLIDVVELSAENFRIPFDFDAPVSLGTGKKKKLVDVVDLTTVTKELRADGVRFTTAASLPAPFGPGPIPTTGTIRLLIAVAEGDDVEACASQVAKFDGATIVETLPDIGLFIADATDSAAARIETLSCVAAIEQEGDI